MTDKELMTLMLYGECRGESQFGKLCVASTVMNRLKLSQEKGIDWWGKTVKEIILSPNQYQGFKLLDSNKISNNDWYACQRVVTAVLDFGIVVPDITHFSGLKVDLEDVLGLLFLFREGGHRFYQEVY